MAKTKIFVSAYACEPNLGSEIGVGWRWVLEMSKYFDLWVLTRSSNQKSIEPWIKEHPQFSNINFLYYDLPNWAKWWKKGQRGVRIYYNIWQCMTNKLVKKAMKENNICVFHHVTYGNALWKVSSYGKKQKFIWGPIGGLETIPQEFTQNYSAKWRFIEWLRRFTVKMLPLNRGFHDRCSQADLIICKTQATYDLIPEKDRKRAILMTDVAVDTDLQSKTGKQQLKSDGVVRYITIGRLDAWRGFDLAIEAFEKLAQKQNNVELCILGKGSEKQKLQELIAKQTAKDKIKLLGQVSHDEYTNLLQMSDVVVNAALKEGAVTVMFDSLAMGKPMVCVETGGYTRMLDKSVAEIVDITERNKVIDGLLSGMERFYDANNRQQVADNAAHLLSSLDWEHKGLAIRDALQKVLS